MNDTVTCLSHPHGPWRTLRRCVRGGRLTATAEFLEAGRTHYRRRSWRGARTSGVIRGRSRVIRTRTGVVGTTGRMASGLVFMGRWVGGTRSRSTRPGCWRARCGRMIQRDTALHLSYPCRSGRTIWNGGWMVRFAAASNFVKTGRTHDGRRRGSWRLTGRGRRLGWRMQMRGGFRSRGWVRCRRGGLRSRRRVRCRRWGRGWLRGWRQVVRRGNLLQRRRLWRTRCGLRWRRADRGSQVRSRRRGYRHGRIVRSRGQRVG
jgi:hypothetical protein